MGCKGQVLARRHDGARRRNGGVLPGLAPFPPRGAMAWLKSGSVAATQVYASHSPTYGIRITLCNARSACSSTPRLIAGKCWTIRQDHAVDADYKRGNRSAYRRGVDGSRPRDRPRCMKRRQSSHDRSSATSGPAVTKRRSSSSGRRWASTGILPAVKEVDTWWRVSTIREVGAEHIVSGSGGVGMGEAGDWTCSVRKPWAMRF